MSITVSTLKSAVVDLQDYCIFAQENDCVVATEWNNGEGYSIEVVSDREETRKIELTHGELEALVDLLEALEE